MRSVCRAADRKQKFALQKRYVKKHILSACIRCAARQRRTAAMLDEIKKLSAAGHAVMTEVRNYRGSPCVGKLSGKTADRFSWADGRNNTRDNSLRAMKARQTRKIEQLREVFLTNGRLRVREQAKLLGLSPSTAHAVLQRNYKNSGLSAAIIKRMLACPNLPESARTIILEYRDEKIAGLYGHTRSQRRRFMTAFATEQNLDSPIQVRKRAGLYKTKHRRKTQRTAANCNSRL